MGTNDVTFVPAGTIKSIIVSEILPITDGFTKLKEVISLEELLVCACAMITVIVYDFEVPSSEVTIYVTGDVKLFTVIPLT